MEDGAQTMVDASTLLGFTGLWATISFSVGRLASACILSSKPNAVARCYGTALIHNIVATCDATRALVVYASTPVQIVCGVPPRGHCASTLLSLHCFIGYLLVDLIHIVRFFPHCGRWDMIAHHAGFIVFTAVAIECGVLPIVGSVLLLHECSTIPLNLRWFIVHWLPGRADGRRALCVRVAEALFVASYFLLRVASFLPFVIHVCATLLPRAVELNALGVHSAFCIGAGLWGVQALYGFWFLKIVQKITLARRGEKLA